MPTVRQQKFGESTNWSSAPLVNHLAGNHKIDKAHQEAFLGSVAVRAPSDQATLTAMMDTEVAASRVLEEAVMDLLCAERLPFRLVESHRFQAVLSAGVRVYDAGLEDRAQGAAGRVRQSVRMVAPLWGAAVPCAGAGGQAAVWHPA